MKAANESNGFSIIADETADISGTEQLSIGVQFVALQEQQNDLATIREEFLGFIPLKRMDTAAIEDTNIDQAKNFGLNLDKLYGQVDAQPWQEKTMVIGPYQEHLAQS